MLRTSLSAFIKVSFERQKLTTKNKGAPPAAYRPIYNYRRSVDDYFHFVSTGLVYSRRILDGPSSCCILYFKLKEAYRHYYCGRKNPKKVENHVSLRLCFEESNYHAICTCTFQQACARRRRIGRQ